MKDKISWVLYSYSNCYLGIAEAQQVIIDFVHNEWKKIEIGWLYTVLRLAKFLSVRDSENLVYDTLALFILKEMVI